MLASVAVVAIGRNEGPRLLQCLESALTAQVAVVVYVDSGSTDDSVQMAESRGCTVVRLDMSTPFTAARARNEGFQRALQQVPDLEYVQFVDGDCEFAGNWLPVAKNFLDCNAKVAVVCGRRRERFPDKSIYNNLCDLEWNSPVGQASSCGGDAMMRVQPLLQVKGYRSDLIAGEEPELCVRIRAAGWQIWRIDHEMTLHDAAMLQFAQWWKRSKRTGHAYFEGAALHGEAPERHWVKQAWRSAIWGGIIPLSIVLLAILVNPMLILLLMVYPLQVMRAYFLNRRKVSWPVRYAVLMVLGKFAELAGGLQYLRNRLASRNSEIIEYK